jgi:hypothetical protein
VLAESEFAERCIKAFLAAIEPVQDAYTNDTFSFIAVKSADARILIRGTLYLNVHPISIQYTSLQSDTALAGHFRLNEITLSREKFIE